MAWKKKESVMVAYIYAAQVQNMTRPPIPRGAVSLSGFCCVAAHPLLRAEAEEWRPPFGKRAGRFKDCYIACNLPLRAQVISASIECSPAGYHRSASAAIDSLLLCKEYAALNYTTWGALIVKPRGISSEIHVRFRAIATSIEISIENLCKIGIYCTARFINNAGETMPCKDVGVTMP